MTDSRAPHLPLFARLVFVAALLFSLVGSVEVGFIGYDLLTDGALSRLGTPDVERGIRSWTVHHSMRPGFSDVDARLNSFGLRSPEVAVPKPAGTTRVLMLGDSFTFGFKVAEQDVFSRHLEHRLRRELRQPHLEVVNAGVVSYCPLLEYLQYRHHLHALDVDLVVLNFDMSDVKDHRIYAKQTVRASDGTPLYATEPTLGRAASAWPKLLSFDWVERQLVAATWGYRSAAGDPRFIGDRDRYAWTLDGSQGFEDDALAAMAPIVDLRRLLQSEGIPLMLATYPQPWQVAADATPDAVARLKVGVEPGSVHLNDRAFQSLGRFAEDQGIRFADATESFRSHPEPASLYLPTDLHFSPLGHQLYSDILARHIVGHRLVSGSPDEPERISD